MICSKFEAVFEESSKLGLEQRARGKREKIWQSHVLDPRTSVAKICNRKLSLGSGIELIHIPIAGETGLNTTVCCQEEGRLRVGTM